MKWMILAGPMRQNMDKPDIFFSKAYASFCRAALHPIKKTYSFAGLPIHMLYANSTLIPAIAQAFSHIESNTTPFATVQPRERSRHLKLQKLFCLGTSENAFTICLWDTASTGVRMAAPDWQWSLKEFAMKGLIDGFNNDRFLTHYSFAASALSLVDLQRKMAIFWTQNASCLPYWERGAPLRQIFRKWLQSINFSILHAGAVGHSHGGVLICGEGGTGKSTTALSCLDEFMYASDDYCAVDSSLAVHSLYCSGKLEAKMLKQLPRLERLCANPTRLNNEKALLFLHPLYARKIIKKMPVKAVVIPKITQNQNVSLHPISSSEAFKALAPSSLFQMPGSSPTEFYHLTRLVKLKPCFRLEVGAHLSAIPASIFKLLKPDFAHFLRISPRESRTIY